MEWKTYYLSMTFTILIHFMYSTNYHSVYPFIRFDHHSIDLVELWFDGSINLHFDRTLHSFHYIFLPLSLLYLNSLESDDLNCIDYYLEYHN